MSDDAEDIVISDPVNLGRQVYADGEDYQLLCCSQYGGGGGSSGGGGSTDSYLWLTAAELVYELTGQPGRVVNDVITFEYEPESTIEIKLLGGHFQVKSGDDVTNSGRKALELLMALRGLTFEQALDWFADKYSTDRAAALGQDYVKMRLGPRAAPPRE